MKCDVNSRLSDWMIGHPETSVVVRRLGIEIGCAGKSLEYVCHPLKLSVQDFLKQLHDAIADRLLSQTVVHLTLRLRDSESSGPLVLGVGRHYGFGFMANAQPD